MDPELHTIDGHDRGHYLPVICYKADRFAAGRNGLLVDGVASPIGDGNPQGIVMVEDASLNGTTTVLTNLAALLPGLETLYKDIHAHPELSMQEIRTAGIRRPATR